MFKPLFVFIGSRYTYVKRKNHFISFISLTSMLGIALGVGVLITVLSVMNGFHREIKREMLSATPHITIQSYRNSLQNWPNIVKKISNLKYVKGVAPFVQGQGMLISGSQVRGAIIQGIHPDKANTVYPLADNMLAGKLSRLKPNAYQILLGKEIAYQLGVSVGDKITLVIPEAQVTLAGMIPRMKRFTIGGIFDAGYQYNVGYVFVHLKDAQTLFKFKNGVSGLQLKIAKELDARDISEKIAFLLNEKSDLQQLFYVSNWTEKYKGFFEAIKMEKTVMSLILFLIVIVAAFNLVSSLVMMVTDKRTDIAILRTLGASRGTIMGIFMAQGLLTGAVGTFLGFLVGVVVAMNVTEMVAWVERLFHVQFVSEQAYFISFVPCEILLSDLCLVVFGSIALSFISTLYPAKRAASIQPAEALRYE